MCRGRRDNEAFARQKADIVDDLSKPDETYTDLSPKGTVDVEVRDLVDVINATPDCVTTSSCAGRISVFLEAPSKGKNVAQTREHDKKPQSVSIKASGGRWLFVSHQPIALTESLDLHREFGLARKSGEAGNFERYVHFKFEPMILHILTASLHVANAILIAAQQAGFRESGISGVLSPRPMVAIRSSGLAVESIIGAVHNDLSAGEENIQAIVHESYLQTMTKIANQRFEKNTDRILRFRHNFERHFHGKKTNSSDNTAEGKEERSRRKRAEGLQRQQRIHDQMTTT